MVQEVEPVSKLVEIKSEKLWQRFKKILLPTRTIGEEISEMIEDRIKEWEKSHHIKLDKFFNQGDKEHGK